MKMAVSLVRVVTIACVFAAIVSGKEKSPADIADELYGTLRKIVFPTGSSQNSGPLENRFLMLMPGKVLNYFDYFPGKEYTKFIQVCRHVLALDFGIASY